MLKRTSRSQLEIELPAPASWLTHTRPDRPMENGTEITDPNIQERQQKNVNPASASKANVEVKARLRSPDRQAKLAAEIAGGPPTVLHQRDTFFHAPQGRLKLREIDPGSSDSVAQLIQYFRDDDPALRVSDYVLSPVADPETMAAALSRSLGVRGVVEKKRSLWIVEQTRIHFDSVLGLGDFVELEFVLRPGQSQSEGHEFASNLMTRLDIDSNDVIEFAYIDLIEQNTQQ